MTAARATGRMIEPEGVTLVRLVPTGGERFRLWTLIKVKRAEEGDNDLVNHVSQKITAAEKPQFALAG